MTDAEILAKLAEIEGWKKVDQGYEYSYGVLADPLNDWGQLGPLIEKHKTYIEWHESIQAWDADILVGPGYVRNASLPHAICLAIIEAHK